METLPIWHNEAMASPLKPNDVTLETSSKLEIFEVRCFRPILSKSDSEIPVPLKGFPWINVSMIPYQLNPSLDIDWKPFLNKLHPFEME